MPDALTPEQQRRQVALKSMSRFADQNGVENREWVERDYGYLIALIGTANDGRPFATGYTKDISDA